MTATAAAAAKVVANPPWSSSHAMSVVRHATRKIMASSIVRGGGANRASGRSGDRFSSSVHWVQTGHKDNRRT
jgi:hypothetical protein